MQRPITVSRQPADATQQGKLESTFTSAGYLLLKEMVAAKCIYAQVTASNLRLYSNSPDAIQKAVEWETRAQEYRVCLDILDECQENPDQLFTVKLEHSR